jgi:hypothetical protein
MRYNLGVAWGWEFGGIGCGMIWGVLGAGSLADSGEGVLGALIKTENLIKNETGAC